MTELTAREGDGDAARTGYWIVTGPQPEAEAYATVELSRITDDDGATRDAYAWYLHQRKTSEYDRHATYMGTISTGISTTWDEAMVELRAAWDEHIGLNVVTDDTAEVIYPWQGN